jgi:hypothetical protein
MRIEGLEEVVASYRQETRAYRPPRPDWRWNFAGWMGLMYGPIPVGHLALGLVGLYFKLR